MAYVYQNIIIGNRLDVNTGAQVITTTKAQLITSDGTTTLAQSAPTANTQVLISDSTQTTGLIWRNLTIADVGLTAGDGLVLVGDQINVGGSTTIFANPDNVIVNSSAVANQVLLSSGTVGTEASWSAVPLGSSAAVSGTLGFTNGGTGSTSYAGGSQIIATNSGNTAFVATGINPADLTVTTATVTTTDATTTTIYTMPTVSGTAYYVTASFLARQTVTPFTTASFQVKATFNNVSGTLTLVGGANDLVYIPSTITWTSVISASSTNIIFQVTGAAATNIDWKVRISPVITVT